MRRKRTWSNLGSTVVEVLMAISVLAVGASGIIAMQKVTTVANKNAKNLGIANEIARTWVERVHADSMLWNFTAQDGTPDIDTDTRWLALNVRAPSAAQWFRPTDTVSKIYGVHDSFGKDDHTLLPDASDPSKLLPPLDGPFCVNMRLTWLRPAQDAVRVEVRVYWLRENIQAASKTLSMQPPKPLCGSASVPAPAVDGATDVFHFVHVTSAVLMHPRR